MDFFLHPPPFSIKTRQRLFDRRSGAVIAFTRDVRAIESSGNVNLEESKIQVTPAGATLLIRIR